VTFKIFFQVVTGNDLCLVAALGKDDAKVFTAFRPSLQGKGGTGPVIAVAFIEIDHPLPHNFGDLFPADMAAIHPAKCMFGIINMCRVAVKSFPCRRFLPSFI